VPSRYQEPLGSTVNDLVDRVETECAAVAPTLPEPVTAPPPATQTVEHARGKAKGHEKRKHGKGHGKADDGDQGEGD
jgi:hypothetical protein